MVFPFSSPVCVLPIRMNLDADLKKVPPDSFKLIFAKREESCTTVACFPLNKTIPV